MQSLDATRNLENHLRQIFFAIGNGRTAEIVEESGGSIASLGNFWYPTMSKIRKLIERGLLEPSTLRLTSAGERFYVDHRGLSNEEIEYAWLSKFQPILL